VYGRMAVVPQGDVVEGKDGRHGSHPIAQAAATQRQAASGTAQAN